MLKQLMVFGMMLSFCCFARANPVCGGENTPVIAPPRLPLEQGRIEAWDISAETCLQNFPSIKGRLVKALRYADATGDNVILLAETGVRKQKLDQYGTTGLSKRLYARRFRADQANAQPVWQITDGVRDCETSLTAAFIPEALHVTDLDNNGVAEVWTGYQLACHGDVSPANMKIIMYEGGQKYAMRGTTLIRMPGEESLGGTGKMDAAFINGPAVFRDHADRLWLEYRTR